MKKLLAIIIALALIGAGAYYWHKKSQPTDITVRLSPGVANIEHEQQFPTLTVPASYQIQDVPFASQSPFAAWDEEENAGCEEASLIMAHHWIQNTPISSPDQAEKELRDIFAYENQNYGNSIDTSSADTAKLFKDYYGGQTTQVAYGITRDDIISEIAKGHLVLIPANGKALNNPHFKQPGPDTHMLVIIGYDNNSQQFITNDPGTKYGQGYAYSYDTLYSAIRDYPTGNHLPITGERKAMIVISK